jgi:hypothetical protein
MINEYWIWKDVEDSFRDRIWGTNPGICLEVCEGNNENFIRIAGHRNLNPRPPE